MGKNTDEPHGVKVYKVLTRTMRGTSSDRFYHLGTNFAHEILLKKGYGLLAFRTYKQALSFINGNHYHYKIFLARGKGEIRPLPNMLSPLSEDAFIKCHFMNYESPLSLEWPKGTRMFAELDLLYETNSEGEPI